MTESILERHLKSWLDKEAEVQISCIDESITRGKIILYDKDCIVLNIGNKSWEGDTSIIMIRNIADLREIHDKRD
jgi:hypothetical protein